MNHREHVDIRSWPRRRGFTLVELVIVVAIVGVLAALAMPRFNSASNRYRAKLCADRVMRDIAHARSRAVALGAQQTMTFTTVSVSYTIAGMMSPDNSSKPFTVVLSAEPYRCTKITVDFGGTGTLTFNGYGVPTVGGTVKVQAGGFECTVTVAAGTGVGSVGALAADTSVGPVFVIAWAD